MPRVLVLATLVATSLTAAAEPCPVFEPNPRVLTTFDTIIPAGGGVVVSSFAEPARAQKPHAPLAKWRLGDGSAVKLRHIAPALDVIVTTAETTVEDADHSVLVHVKHVAEATAQADAPVVKSLVHSAPAAGRHPQVSITATLDVPAGMVGLVVFDKSGTKARSWGGVGYDSVTVYASGGCPEPPSGTIESPIGDHVRLAWIDGAGQLSKLSPPIEVTAAKP